MPFVLKKGVYSVKCRHPHCPFNSLLEVDANLMGVTEADVESEAIRLARDMAQSKHDSMSGLRHTIENPEIRRVSGSCHRIGVLPHGDADSDDAVTTREFRKGDVILKKGDAATSVCEVLAGIAYPERNTSHRYEEGDCFGAAALLANHTRMADVLSGADGTRVSFYDLVALSRKDPQKASRVFTSVMEDAFRVIAELERSVDRYRRQVAKKGAA